VSDASQGPGWWLASDGKWYPPEQAPQPQPPQPPSPAPTPGPPTSMPPPVPQQSGQGSGISKGCIYALVAAAAVVVVGVFGAIALIAFVGDKAVDELEEAADDDPCPFLTNAQASDAFGNGVRVVELSGFNSLLGITVDTRILEDAPDCVVLSSDDAAIARAARYQGSDASSVFAEARDIADGTSQDQGGGLSIETDAYLSDQAVTVGDEGFCTTSSLLGSAGALVRRGDTLVYVSIQPDIGTSGTVPDLDLEAGGFATDSGNCTTAQEVAETILG
jgi:hypothetical protein